MTEQRQKPDQILGEKYNVPIYKSNPSIPKAQSISRKKKTKFGDEEKGFVIDKSDGEVLSVGGVCFYEFEEVDDTKFVKLFLAGVKQAAGLSKSGLALFEVVYNEIQQRPNEDEVKLGYFIAKDKIKGLTKRTYQRGMNDLLSKNFLFRSPTEGVFFVNIQYMFNGDRLAFVKGYERKSTSKQKELDFDSAE